MSLFWKLGENGVDICIRGYTKPGEQWGLMGELLKRIKNRFDQVGIEILWPHTKVYFVNNPETDKNINNVLKSLPDEKDAVRETMT
ncbi:MAG: mechanosensitive ion channel family protein [Spirochaetales bacterium]|nr:mechanosensitive ion channel family protein [Spirochaetales bacterium]